MGSQAQIRRPGHCDRCHTGVEGPVQAEIPEARAIDRRFVAYGGPEGRSRMKEVAAA